MDDEAQQTSPKRRKRETWVRPWIERRKEFGCYHHLACKRDSYKNFVRMNSQHFCLVVDQVSYRIQKQNTIMRESNIPDERMAVTLQFLATGETCKSLVEYSFRISRTAISHIVIEKQATHQIMGANNLKIPSRTNDLELVLNLMTLGIVLPSDWLLVQCVSINACSQAKCFETLRDRFNKWCYTVQCQRKELAIVAKS
jgi:transcriptional regulator of NAD metabolism